MTEEFERLGVELAESFVRPFPLGDYDWVIMDLAQPNEFIKSLADDPGHFLPRQFIACLYDFFHIANLYLFSFYKKVLDVHIFLKWA